MSPIFVRPVREQLEHDRLIRHLVTRYKRKVEAVGNVGDEQIAPVRLGAGTYYPDIVLLDGKKLAGLIEVETSESVNNLEAMAQWVPFSRSRVPFHLYVPVHTYDVARRFCESHQAAVTEIWTYRAVADGFDLVRLFHDAGAAARKPAKSLGGPAKALPLNTPPAKIDTPPAAKAVAKAEAPLPAKVPARPEPKTPAKTEAKADSKLHVKPAVKADTKGSTKAAPKPAIKADTKAPVKAAPKAPAKAETKPPTKAPAATPKPGAKAAPATPKPVAKSGGKPETKSPTKAAKAPAKAAAPKPNAKSTAKAAKR